MRIGEMIQRSGLSKKTIHYYVQDGLLQPQQEDNGYLNFTEDDLRRLECIHRMRYMGFSLEKIRSILKEPALTFYYFLKQRRELQKEADRLEWRISTISRVLENLSTDITYETLLRHLAETVKLYPEDSGSKLIDDSDAELLAYFFWGRFAGRADMTEYQKFLWEKMKKTIVLTQTPSMRQLRDQLYLFQGTHVNAEFLNPDHNEKRRDEIAALTEDDYPGYVDYLIENAWKNLKDPLWVRQYLENQAYLINAGRFFDSEASTLMCELSPLFKKYQVNINQCGELLKAYLHSEQGEALLDLIHEMLPEELDLYSNHCAALIGICTRASL